MKRKDEKTLALWQQRLAEAEAHRELSPETMKRREDRYDGRKVVYSPDGVEAKKPIHVRNIVMEIVETQVDSTIPAPKVTALHQEDEKLARIIECMISNVMDRLPMERINDEAERISPLQGGFGLQLGWDSSAKGRGWMGQLTVDLLHPREIIPQPGVYQVEDMDWIFLKQAKTKRQIKTQYGVDVSDESEEAPEVRNADGATDGTGELVTQCTVYYRNSSGGIGRFAWVGETVLEDLEDYQARQVHICRACGAVGDGHKCRYCGGTKFDREARDSITLDEDVVTALGTRIPAEQPAVDEWGMPIFAPANTDTLLPQLSPPGGIAPLVQSRQVMMEPTKIPYFRPAVYPIIIRKNVSRPGRFWGGSDADAVEEQQNGANAIGSKIKSKVLSSGSFVTKPSGTNFVSDSDTTVLEVDSPKTMQMIRTFSTSSSINDDMTLRSELYEEARQIIGVTDSMQGRRDPTATSAVAKEFSAQQAQGRMESKRVMKQALFQDLFERIFLWMLAYSEEPRVVRSTNDSGDREYLEFNRFDFLYQDESGEWQWNTDFLFSCDASAPLARDRQAMWQETRLNFREGTFGPPNRYESVLRFWEQMDVLHYPMAGAMKEKIRREIERAAQQQGGLANALLSQPTEAGNETLEAAEEGGLAL